MAENDNLHQIPEKFCTGNSFSRWLMRKTVYESTEFYDSLLIVGPLWFLAYIVFSGFPDLDRFVAGAFYQGEGSWAGDHLSFLDAVPEWGDG